MATAAKNETPNGQAPIPGPDPVAAVRAVLSLPENQLDYARAKVALDAIVDPGIDQASLLAELDRMADRARRMAGPGAGEAELLNALRTLIYRPGLWNGHRPFDYDHENFKDIRVKLMSHYLKARRGNCVSMPILFLILADKLRLRIALAMASAHLFVRWHDPAGEIVNLETTSGANPARDEWLREAVGYTDRGVASGFYMRSLRRRESVAAMALTVVEHLMAEHRFRDALSTTKLVLQCNPRDRFAWAHQGQACFRIPQSEYFRSPVSKLTIPNPIWTDYIAIFHLNRKAFANAERLGWESQSPRI